MAIQIIGGVSGSVAEVGAASSLPLHTVVKPIPYGALGHYRTAVAITMATSQAANSRLFELRNTHATNLIVMTRCRVSLIPGGTITTAYIGQLSLFRCTGFTVVDTTNTVTPTSSPKKATMNAYPGNAQVRHCTLAGAAAGMTGGTLTKDAQALGIAPFFMTTAAAGTIANVQELLDDMNGMHPPVFAQNEGFEVENTIVGSATSNVATAIIDVSWAEVTAF